MLIQGLRFMRGLRRLLRDPISFDEAREQVAHDWRSRNQRFLRGLDDLVWSVPASPYRGLFNHAGIGREDVVGSIGNNGLEKTLAVLREEGVYVAYEEFLGTLPARRGSAVFHFRPQDFFNPRMKPDFIGGSGGTRSGGVPAASSFDSIRGRIAQSVLRAHIWGVLGAPRAVWAPALPSGTLGAMLGQGAQGNPARKWFSQVPPYMPGVAFKKKVTTLLIPYATRLHGVRLPKPEHVPTSNPDPVLEWCREALAKHGRAELVGYASSIARLAAHALDRGISLQGLVLVMGGEPVTAAKMAVARASGAQPTNAYSFSPAWSVAYSCPACPDEELHLLEDRVAVVDRARPRADGVEVRAFLWTSLDPQSGSLLINMENDDYGEIRHDSGRCTCALGAMGMRTKLLSVRGISKVVAGGVTVKGEVFERLAEETLPRRFGGGPGDYQFVEEEQNSESVMSLRVDPRLGPIDESAVLAAVRATLRGSEIGLLADEVWSPSGALKIVRAPAVQARSGKTLPFETLKRQAPVR